MKIEKVNMANSMLLFFETNWNQSYKISKENDMEQQLFFQLL